jgi:hypothetical protein
MSRNRREIVPTPSVCSPKPGCSSHWSLRIFILGFVAVKACATRAAYLLGIPKNFEESPRDNRIFSEVTYPSTGSRKGETNQTKCSRSARVKYAGSSKARPPSSKPWRKIPPTRCLRNQVTSTSPSQRYARRSSLRNSTRTNRSAIPYPTRIQQAARPRS